MTKQLCFGYLEPHECKYVKEVFPEVKFTIKITRFIYVEDIVSELCDSLSLGLSLLEWFLVTYRNKRKKSKTRLKKLPPVVLTG